MVTTSSSSSFSMCLRYRSATTIHRHVPHCLLTRVILSEPRCIIRLPHGRHTVQRSATHASRHFIHLTYTSRAFEWLPLRKIFRECLSTLHPDGDTPDIDSICFGWRYLPPVASVCYYPFQVFCQFSIDQLIFDSTTCICHNKRFIPFHDALTIQEPQLSTDIARPHVRTSNLEFIHNPFLRRTLAAGLNHSIPQPTTFSKALDKIQIAWLELREWLLLDSSKTTAGAQILSNLCYQHYSTGAQQNFGHVRQHQSGVFSTAATSELSFLTEHFYFAGLDKASNNVCIICIHHIRLQALHRLQGPDFIPESCSIDAIISHCHAHLEDLIPEITF